MPTFTLSIGRRIGTGENLSREDWYRFQAAVEGAITDHLHGTVYFAGRGGGIFEGVYEESATWVFAAEPLPAQRDRFEYALAFWAAKYGQESVALTEGETQFIERAPEVAVRESVRKSTAA